MRKIFKLTMNLTLLLMLLSMLALPTGFMGIISYEENPVVLSAQDSREPNTAIRSFDDPEATIPEDVRDIILKMEETQYKQNKQFTGDIERQEDIEQVDDSLNQTQEEIPSDVATE